MASSGHLKPGEVGMIYATVQTTGKRGLLRKNVSVRSNDPENPVSVLLIKATVSALGLTPPASSPLIMHPAPQQL